MRRWNHFLWWISIFALNFQLSILRNLRSIDIVSYWDFKIQILPQNSTEIFLILLLVLIFFIASNLLAAHPNHNPLQISDRKDLLYVKYRLQVLSRRYIEKDPTNATKGLPLAKLKSLKIWPVAN